MVDPKGLTLWGAFKKRWISFLETTFIFWRTPAKIFLFSPKEKSVETQKAQMEVPYEVRRICQGFH
jgi:hypothetical protein